MSADNSRYQIQLTSSASHLSNGSASTSTRLIKRKSESSVGKKESLYCRCCVEFYLNYQLRDSCLAGELRD